jgi:hypothetical protein
MNTENYADHQYLIVYVALLLLVKYKRIAGIIGYGHYYLAR